MSETWNILLIEDNAEIVRQVHERFDGKELAGRAMQVIDVQDWGKAFDVIKDRKADVVILDIYRGEANKGGERIGEKVFQSIRERAFIPVIIHTALSEGLEGLTNEFVRLVPKEAGLGEVRAQLEAIFNTRVPQIHRAIATHIDHTLRDYMWDFVVKNWGELSAIGGKPEFVRILVQRLAMSFASAGVDGVVKEVFPVGEAVADEKVHPAELYIKPPLGSDPVLGDVRARTTGNETRHLVVLWPTCDMVSTGTRVPKTEKVLCAYANPLAESEEYKDYSANRVSNGARKRLVELLKNNRDRSKGNSDRFHFLPGLCDIPDLLVDFQDLEHLSLNDVKSFKCLGTLRSPFAELLSGRFERYRNRIGTPDLDNDLVVDRCFPGANQPQPEAIAPDAGTPNE